MTKKRQTIKKEKKETLISDNQVTHKSDTPQKLSCGGGVPGVVTHAKFRQNWLKGFGSLRGRNPPVSVAIIITATATAKPVIISTFCVTKWKKDMFRFLYHTKDHLA